MHGESRTWGVLECRSHVARYSRATWKAGRAAWLEGGGTRNETKQNDVLEQPQCKKSLNWILLEHFNSECLVHTSLILMSRGLSGRRTVKCLAK